MLLVLLPLPAALLAATMTALFCHPPPAQVEGSTADEYWQALGAYALPGQLVNVTVPARLVATGGATLHIGGWTDLNYQ